MHGIVTGPCIFSGPCKLTHKVPTEAAHTSQAMHETPQACFTLHTLALVTVVWYPQVGNNGGIEGLVVDTAGRYISSSYARRISLHEAGHFLIAYLIGLLPKVYTLSTLDAVQR